MTTSPSPDNIIDVAIIGGGVSGAYTAYRLMNSDPDESPVLKQILEQSGKDKLNVRLIEMSNRIGGRLWSINLPHLPNLPAEMGGMCFSQLQRNVYGLCTQELGLETKRSDLYYDNNLQYFRGHHFWGQDYEPRVDPTHLRDDYYPSVVPFFLHDDEKWQNPGKLLARLFENVPGFHDFMSSVNIELDKFKYIEPSYVHNLLPIIYKIGEFLREAEFVDPVLKTKSPLYEYGFWNVIVNLFSPDACNLIEKSMISHSNSGDDNLYNFSIKLLLSEFFDRSYHGLTAGYDALPNKLVENFRDMGGVVNMGTQLLNLQWDKKEQLIKLVVNSQTEPDLYARYVVLALPQRPLKQLFDHESSILSKYQLSELDSVSASPAYKLILAYDEPWWEQIDRLTRFGEPAQITRGFSVTDLPLKACYYVGPDSDQNKHSLLIASLSDRITEGFWSSLRPGVDPSSCIKPGPYVNPKSKIVMQAQQLIKELHCIDQDAAIKIPEPVAGLFWNWKDDPFGGGWHLWNPGVASWKVAPRIRQPNPDFNVFLCGEAYSEQQGWVEGALNSAEMVLEEHFKLPRPNWVPDTYRFDF